MSSFVRHARALAAFAVVVAVAMLDASSSSATDATPNGDPPITTFSDPGHHLRRPRDIVAGPDGNLWFTADTDQIGRITPGGELTLYRDPAGLIDAPDTIVTGGDGALWFTSLGDRVGRITTSGDITSFPVGGGDAWGPLALAPAPTATSGSPPRATRSAG